MSLTDAVPAGTTFVSASQDEGPAFTCTHPAAETTGTSTCTIASLPANTAAAFTFIYEVDSGLTDGTEITNTASSTTETSESKPDNNSLSASTRVNSPACTVNVPGNITVNNALGQGGATVTFDDPTTSGSCGAVTCDHTSGSFFPIGTTPVTCTDATSGAADSFFVTVNDTEMPTISCPANVSGFENPAGSGFGPASFAAPTAADNGAIDVSLSHQSGDLFPVGTTTVTAAATDAAGNTATDTFTVTVLYNFTGFFAPVNNQPVFNQVKAGQGVPIKFSLSGNKGLGIMFADFPMSQPMACDTGAMLDPIEETVTAGGSTLSYDPTSDAYIYTWKTEKQWANTCRMLTVKLNDGTSHTAYFKFLK